MTTKQAQHLEPGDRVQTLLGVLSVHSVYPDHSYGFIEYWLDDPAHNQIIVRHSMPEWKVEIA